MVGVWTVWQRWPKGSWFAFSCYWYKVMLFMLSPSKPVTIMWSQEGVTQDDPLVMTFGLVISSTWLIQLDRHFNWGKFNFVKKDCQEQTTMSYISCSFMIFSTFPSPLNLLESTIRRWQRWIPTWRRSSFFFVLYFASMGILCCIMQCFLVFVLFYFQISYCGAIFYFVMFQGYNIIWRGGREQGHYHIIFCLSWVLAQTWMDIQWDKRPNWVSQKHG